PLPGSRRRNREWQHDSIYRETGKRHHDHGHCEALHGRFPESGAAPSCHRSTGTTAKLERLFSKTPLECRCLIEAATQEQDSLSNAPACFHARTNKRLESLKTS